MTPMPSTRGAVEHCLGRADPGRRICVRDLERRERRRSATRASPASGARTPSSTGSRRKRGTRPDSGPERGRSVVHL